MLVYLFTSEMAQEISRKEHATATKSIWTRFVLYGY